MIISALFLQEPVSGPLQGGVRAQDRPCEQVRFPVSSYRRKASETRVILAR